MIQLYSFGASFGIADPSPFVLKINIYLKMANIEFNSIPQTKNLNLAPKGKLPFIIDDGNTIADSQFIIEYLKNKYGDKLDKDLNKEQQATAYLITKSLDENLYFILLYSRWVRDDTWPIINKFFFGKFPLIFRLIFPSLIRRSVIKNVKGQGLSLHTLEEIKLLCHKTFQALSDLLANKKYFFGDKPSSLDATAFAFLAEFILVDFDNPFNLLAREYPLLVKYCQNIQQHFY